MKKLLAIAGAAAISCLPMLASAVTFDANYSITANSSDPGLVVHTHKLNDPLNFDLELGEHVSIKLFDIWTDETDVGSDDTASSPISVNFNFTSPIFTDDVGGTTQGEKVFFSIFHQGTVTWNDPVFFNFGPNGLGILRVTLTDKTFNKGLFGLNEGEKYGATIKAKFKLIAEPTSVLDVPVPAALPLFASALLGLGALSMRRRKRA